MDLSALAQATILSGTAVALTTEILKSKYIPVPATDHPRVTALVLSVATSLYAVYQYNAGHSVALTWQGFIALAAMTLLVSALTYNHVIKGA